MGPAREWPWFILTRGLCLCAVLLAGTAALLVKAGHGFLRLYDYAGQFQLAALVSFGCALIGSLLMEDLLRYYGE